MKRNLAALGLCCTIVAMIAASCPAPVRAQAPPDQAGQWSPVMTWGAAGGVEAVHTVLLPTGKLMFWSTWRESVGMWDPATNAFSSPPLPAFNVFCAGHAWLPDGRLFVAGGHVSNYNGEARADIYNPFTNVWASASGGPPSAPSMGPSTGSAGTNNATSGKRWYPSATTLGNGDVLVLSGDVVTQGITNRRVQIYQTATNTWRELTGALRPSDDLLPEYPRVFVAPDGRAVSLSDNSNDTEFLDMSGTGSWSYLSETLDPNLHNYGPAVMYDTGKIAYIGGGHSPTRNISLLDLTEASPAWRYAGGGTTPPDPASPYVMAQGRRHNNATILADGTVLITGGTSVTGWNDPNGLIATSEIWDPVTEQVTQLAPANAGIYRGYHSTATLLPDGRVLITGGDHSEGGPIPAQNNNAEIYSPPYLFKGARPTVAAAPDVVELGDTIFVATPDAADIAKALWVVPGQVTHAHNWTQRANVLDVAAVAGGLNITLPASGDEAPPGYYMLFLVNSAGVPSVAEWIRAELRTVVPDNADFNGDLAVDGADFLAWQQNLDGVAGKTRAQGDANDDGLVDGSDLAVWNSQFGVTPPSTGAGGAVPEPAGAAIVAAAVGAAALRRRR